MTDVTAPQFQEDVNNTADWANGDENTTVTMRLGQQADSPAKVIKRVDDLAAAQREDIYENATPYTVGNFTDGFTYTALNQRGEFGGDQYVFLGGLDGLPHEVDELTDPTLSPSLYAKANYNDAASVANANGGNVQEFINLRTPIAPQPLTAYNSGQLLFIDSDLYTYNFTVKNSNAGYTSSILELVHSKDVELTSFNRKSLTDYEYPLSWTGPTPSITKSSDGSYYLESSSFTDFANEYSVKETDPKAAGARTYYVNTDGNDANDGLTESTALRSINAALSKSDVLTIMVRGDKADRAGYVWTSNTEKSVNVIGYGEERAVIFNPRNPLFTANAASNVWEMTDSAPPEKPSSVKERDEHGLPIGYKKVGSIIEVSQNIRSYHIDGNTIYVHSGQEPVRGVDIYATLKGFGNSVMTTVANTQDVTVYTENLVWPNTVRCFSDDTNSNWYANNCAAVSGDANDPWLCVGVNTIFNKCIAAYSEADGFSYDDGTQVENHCIAYSNGLSGSGSNQASTTHITAKTLRINCFYEGAGQNVILDVGTGQTINLGVKTIGGSALNCIQAAASRDMWSVDCAVGGVSSTDQHYSNDGSGDFYIDGDVAGLSFDGVVKIMSE